MERIKKIIYKEKEILSIDYSNCKENEMIDLVTEVRNLILHENKEVLLLAIFNSKNYVTPKFLKHLESGLTRIEKFNKKNSVIGLSKTQLWILKGLNLVYKKKIYHFESEQEAFDFLTE